MAPEQDLIKQELLYAREIRRTFERAIAGINPLKKVILSRIGKGAAIKTRIQKKTREIYLLGKGNATTDIRQSLKKLSAAKIEDEILLGPFEDELVDAYTTETLGYMDYFAKDLQDEFNITLREGYMLGESIPELSKRIADTWKVNKVRATRFARTQTNEVYNAAHTVTYLTEPAIENIQFMAHLDSRTSAICRFYDGTIWRKDDPSIQRPPLHFNCLVAGTQITTPNGNKPIEELTVGDLVLTHTGTFKEVTDTMNRVAQDLIEIETGSSKINITKNHPVLTVTNGVKKWVAAGMLKEGDAIVNCGYL